MPNVLLVDDEPSIRLTMGEFLKRAGYSVLIAADYDSAVVHEAEDLDVAVIDINLPGKSGIQLLQKITEARVYVPVIMITGEPNLSVIPEIVRAGAYDFIAKPIIKDVLLTAVARAAEKKRLTDEKRRLEHEIKRYAEELEMRVDERTAELIETHKRLVTQERIAALGRAAAQVAHEVKNPLAGLLLYSLHLKSKSSNFSESQTYLVDKIVDTIKHLNNRVEQILVNLLGNAIKYAPEQSTVRVSVTARGGRVVYEVEDEGPGVPPGDVERIFDIYVTKAGEESRGLGLGLPLSRRLAQLLGGELHAVARPGKGGFFILEVPASPS
jgi:signal transduction histidine kinase